MKEKGELIAALFVAVYLNLVREGPQRHSDGVVPWSGHWATLPSANTAYPRLITIVSF